MVWNEFVVTTRADKNLFSFDFRIQDLAETSLLLFRWIWVDLGSPEEKTSWIPLLDAGDEGCGEVFAAEKFGSI